MDDIRRLIERYPELDETAPAIRDAFKYLEQAEVIAKYWADL